MKQSLGTWLHISDLHFRAGERYDRDVVLSALLTSVERFMEDDIRPDAIFVTGDIAQSGKAAEYSAATRFFDRLLAITGLSKKQLVVVPGNHDVDREGGHFLARTLGNAAEADLYFDPAKPKHHIAFKQTAYSDWFSSYFDGVADFSETGSCSSIRIIDIGSVKAAVLPINSAIFAQDDQDHGQLWLGRRCISEACREMNSLKADLKLALVHHPVDWMHPAEAGNIATSLRETFDGILRGHLHESAVESVADVKDSTLLIAAGAAYQTREYPNRAMFVFVVEEGLSILPIRYEDTPREIWLVDPTVFPFEKDYRGFFSLAALQRQPISAASALNDVKDSDPINLGADGNSLVSNARTEFEAGLFFAPPNKPIYVEPRLMDHPQEMNTLNDVTPSRITVADIVRDTAWYVIEARSEYGGTTVARRLAADLEAEGSAALYRDARHLPKYKKKLEDVFGAIENIDKSDHILILDNFENERDERLLKEIRGLNIFKRLILITSGISSRKSSLFKVEAGQEGFKYVYLWSIERSDIRSMATTFFESSDTDYISSIVDKVYGDLIGLCIPLTPSNVLMYLRVLYREGDFYPLNRVDIVERYLSELLRKPSDLYKDSFTVKNKLDVVSAFVFDLYKKEKPSFSKLDWDSFCARYMLETLTNFDHEDIFSELELNRVFIRIGLSYYLKYSFFFSFFLGRHISRRQNLVTEFTDQSDHYAIDGLVEVISGLSNDNTLLISSLTDKVEGYLDQYFQTYVNDSFDPFKDAIWPRNEDEEERVWDPISKEIEEGPKTAGELDIVKSSAHSEARSHDQNVRFEKFVELEIALFLTSKILIEALRGADDASGDLKKRACMAVFRSHLVALQIGAILAPAIAQRPVVSWGGVRFINATLTTDDDNRDVQRATLDVLTVLSTVIAKQCAEEIAARKMGEVFKALARENLPGFLRLVLFACILSSKPNGWSNALERMIQETDKTAFYLNRMLELLRRDFKTEVNRTFDRDSLKNLIALVRTKREMNKNNPGAKIVKKIAKIMEDNNLFGGNGLPDEPA